MGQLGRLIHERFNGVLGRFDLGVTNASVNGYRFWWYVG